MAENSVIDVKLCGKCCIKKPLNEFYKRKASKDGLQYKCKECMRKWDADNKERRRSYAKKWRTINLSICLEKEKTYRVKNSAKRAEIARLWRERNVDHVIEYQHNYEAGRRERRAAERREALALFE